MLQNENDRAVYAAELRSQAEAIIRNKAMQAPEYLADLPPAEIRQIFHELQVHQVELEMQNEELGRIQGELELSRSRYFDLYDLAPVGYCTVGEKGLILEANLTAANLLNTTRGILIKLPLSRFISGEDQNIYYLHHKKLFETGEPQVCELRMKKTDETRFWARLTAVSAKNDDYEPISRVVISDITGTKQAEEEIEALLREKELLLKEVHHRVKNNINTIASMLSLQSRSISNPEAISVLQEAVGRINSISVLYDKLLVAGDFRELSVKQYIDDLACASIALYPGNVKITLEKQIDEFRLNSKLLFPVGIIVNELLTNIIKYAFTGRNNGMIRISLVKTDNHITLTIQDNGTGLPGGFDINKSKGLGLMLVQMLSLQLKGNFVIENHDGVRCTFVFDI